MRRTDATLPKLCMPCFWITVFWAVSIDLPLNMLFMFSDWNFFDFSPFVCDPDEADMLNPGAHLDAKEPVERTAKLGSFQ